jgi:hypothetical protein
MWEWGCKITDSVLLVLQLHVLRLELKVNILTKKKKRNMWILHSTFPYS